MPSCLAYPDRGVIERYMAVGHVFHWRMACYCHWQVARGVVDYATPLQAEMEYLAGFGG